MRIVAFLLLISAIGWADPILIGDPFHAPTWPTAGYDVIGERSDFDIQWISANVNWSVSTFQLAFNTRNADLSPYPDFGFQLDLGDLLFEVNDEFKYGVPLVSHAGSPNGGPWSLPVVAGALYRINDPDSGVLTAGQVLNNPGGVIYRPEEEVWLRNDGQGSLDALAAGTLAVAPFGDGAANAEYLVTVQFPTPAGFFNDFLNPGLELHFANATCANDIAEGMVQAPEAGTYMLLGTGLLALGFLNRRLRRH